MALTIDTNGDELILTLPNGRRSLSIPCTAAGLTYVRRILEDAKRYERDLKSARGYIAAYPTQHVIDIWIKQDRARQQAERESAVQEKYGIDLQSLKIRL